MLDWGYNSVIKCPSTVHESLSSITNTAIIIIVIIIIPIVIRIRLAFRQMVNNFYLGLSFLSLFERIKRIVDMVL